MKSFIFHRNVLIFILLAIPVLFLILYAYQFSSGLSGEHEKWSQFGDYFNGVISPIFAAINIYLFWSLTKVIDLNNERRHQQDAEHEKAMIKMQFRKAEIDKLEDVLQKVLAPAEGSGKSPYYRSGTAAVTYILNFVNTKLGLFNLGPNDETTKHLFSLHKRLGDYCEELIKVGSDAEKLSNNLLEDFLTLKSYIIYDLQEITLNC